MWIKTAKWEANSVDPDQLHYAEVYQLLRSNCQNVQDNYCKLTLLLLITSCPVLANSVDPDQLASEEANWSESALFVIKYMNFYQKLGSSNLIGWKLEVSMAS